MKQNLWLVLISLMVGACSTPSPPTGLPQGTYPVGEAPSPSLEESAYPAASVTTSPLAGQVPPFRLDKPIVAGATQVSGSGPAGVPIIVADVTFMGAVLGEAVISSAGTFVVTLSALDPNHRIGLALGDLSQTQWTQDDFLDPAYYGDEAMPLPQVGFFYDTALVQAN